MDLFEYQGKEVFARFGLPVLPGDTATTLDAAVAIADAIGYPVVIKAQVQVGGRGKAGGIKLAANADEARTHASNILGMDIKGHTVHVVYVTRAVDIAEEYYASFTLDRSAKKHLGMLSREGGVDIEEVAATNPDAIARIHVDPVDGLSEAQLEAWVAAAGLNPQAVPGVIAVLRDLYRCYVEGDCTLAEINPLILAPEGGVHVLDAKVSLDESARHRHPEWAVFEEAHSSEGDSREAMAKSLGLQYVGLDGSVGILANGAGLAMSTLDIVNQVGGSPANFLDIGGGADADVVANALSVINTDPNVRAIFINIFGGITRGEKVAQGILDGMSRVTLKAPVVVRLDGTNAEQGRDILSGHVNDQLRMAPTMLDAAQQAVALAGGAHTSQEG